MEFAALARTPFGDVLLIAIASIQGLGWGHLAQTAINTQGAPVEAQPDSMDLHAASSLQPLPQSVNSNNEVVRIERTRDVALSTDLRMEFMATMARNHNKNYSKYANGDLTERLRKANAQSFAAGLKDDSIAVFVAYVGDEMAGSGILQEQHMLPNAAVPSGRFGVVLNVFVRDIFRRKGVAAKLMAAVIEEGKRRGLDRLDLKATEMGEHLYRKLGWAEPPGGKPLEFLLH